MRLPAPSAMLIEHPAVPVPKIMGAVVESQAVGPRIEPESLSHRDRCRVALQLTAAASLLAEFDLWPGRRAVRDAVIVRTQKGLRASLARFPVPLSEVYTRLGGGEGAAETTRLAMLKAISETVALPLENIDADKGEPGFFLEGAIARQLRELPRPLDLQTARALWALRWDVLPPPDTGVASYWQVPFPDLARRLAAALWASIRHRNGEAWLWPAGEEETGTAPVPALGGSGVLIVSGSIGNDELAAVSRWTGREGCSAVVIGTYPPGWSPPPPPGFDIERIQQHLAVAGLPLEDARQVVEARRGRFDPLDPNDRTTLCEAARTVFAPGTARRRDMPARRSGDLAHWLSLANDGLPPGFVELQSGLAPEEIELQRRNLGVVVHDGRWRLSQPVLLERDPLHLHVAALYETSDPRHLIHRTLGDGDTTELAKWARHKLDHLDGNPVRELLSDVAPAVLGHDLQALLTEACLSVLDLSGARAAMNGLPAAGREVFSRWLEALDQPPGTRRRLPEGKPVEIYPRAAAEASLLMLRVYRRRSDAAGDAARSLVDAAIEDLPPLLKSRFEIDIAWTEEPEKLEDAKWRRNVNLGHPVLRALIAHRRALYLADTARTRCARRLLDRLAAFQGEPGILGMIELDRGYVALAEGRSREADTLQLRAFRLLQAAGFRNRTRHVLFNLAVSDIDQLRLDRAEKRLKTLEDADPSDLFVHGERARLELAKGEIDDFRARVEAFRGQVREDDPRFLEGLALLNGVVQLMDGHTEEAENLLRRAGQEGEAWTTLAQAVAGNPIVPGESDAWGVGQAAEIVAQIRSSEPRPPPGHPGETTGAAAIAIAECFAGLRLNLDEAARTAAARTLRERGLTGWAERLIQGRRNADGFVEALERIVCHGGPDGLDPSTANSLVEGLGLGGLEVRDSADNRLLWRAGNGARGTEVRYGRLSVAPLGGEVPEGPSWRLLLGILDVFRPSEPPDLDPSIGESGFFGRSEAAQQVRKEIENLGPTHLPILVHGETGVGKEVVARALHRASGRGGAFVPVNVAAIPAGLLEAELFGSVRGAYTGADRARQGLAVSADRGTLFLDEVGDLDPPLQVKLLRFLENQEVRAVGSNHPRTVDVRIVSATHHDLGRRVREGGFRQDLYYRIAAPPIFIPPLRDRREDIHILAELFEREALNRHGIESSPWSPDAEAVLLQHEWPGNVRELRQTVEVALVRASGGVVKPEHLPIALREKEITGTWEQAQRDFRRRFLRSALKRNHGNRSATARELGISRQALLYHLRNLGLQTDSRR